MTSIYDFSARLLNGEAVSLAQFKGQVLLIVNVASECGFTPQYAALQDLYARYHAQGFSILAFPCNQFGRQEPGSAEQIHDFCTRRYSVNFPIFDKIKVNGSDAHPLYEWLKAQKSGVFGTPAIKWNFTKFLAGRDGEIVGRYAPAAKPEALIRPIETALALSPA